MCGIAGIVVSPTDKADLDVGVIVKALGLSIEHRGKHATGVAVWKPSGRVRVAKAPRPATEFFARRPGLGIGADLVIIHTRAATQGDPKNPLNNHPVAVGDIVGIHNGIIHNDDELYRMHPDWVRSAEVD